jgi:hypothetical protein
VVGSTREILGLCSFGLVGYKVDKNLNLIMMSH